MISMRYAWNFSHGKGLVWNPGDYVAGYTNLLMTLLMSVVTGLCDKLTAVLLIQISGIGFMLGIAALTLKISDSIVETDHPERRTLIRIISFGSALAYYPLAYWSLMGMETGLLTWLLLAGILCSLRYAESKKPIFLWLAAVCLGLAYLTRSDSIIFALLIWLYLIWEIWSGSASRQQMGRLILAIGFFLVFVIGQLSFQYLYYGEWFPNTYTLKLTGMPFLPRIQNGLSFISLFLVVTAFPLVLSAWGLLVQFRKQKLLLLLIVISAIGYQVYVGGDPWVYWRILSPTMPLLITLFISAINTGVRQSSKLPAFFLRIPMFPRKYDQEIMIISLALIGWVSVNMSFLPELTLWEKPYHASNHQIFVNTSIALNELTTSTATVGVFWSGIIPYFTGRPAIDFLGKSDRYIAQLPPDLSGAAGGSNMTSMPGHNKYDLTYSIKKFEPTYVQSFQWGTQNLFQWNQSRYVTVGYKGTLLCLRKDSPSVLWSKVMAEGAILREGCFL